MKVAEQPHPVSHTNNVPFKGVDVPSCGTSSVFSSRSCMRSRSAICHGFNMPRKCGSFGALSRSSAFSAGVLKAPAPGSSVGTGEGTGSECRGSRLRAVGDCAWSCLPGDCRIFETARAGRDGGLRGPGTAFCALVGEGPGRDAGASTSDSRDSRVVSSPTSQY